MLSDLNMEEVRQHYLERRKVHVALMKAFDGRNAAAYVPLALGIADNAGKCPLSSDPEPTSIFEELCTTIHTALSLELPRNGDASS